MTNSRLTDPEVLEWRFPVRLESFEIRHGSGGRGQWQGGKGAVRRMRFLEPMTAAILSGHRLLPPPGRGGGAAGGGGGGGGGRSGSQPCAAHGWRTRRTRSIRSDGDGGRRHLRDREP